MFDRLKNAAVWTGIFLVILTLHTVITFLFGLAMTVIPTLAAYLLGGWVDPQQAAGWSLGMEMVITVSILVTLSNKKRHRRTGADRKPSDQPSAREAQDEGR